jgi:Xaa-Pro aminopeptidase
MPETDAQLLISDSLQNADMLYATRFWVHDPFVHLRIGRRKIVVLSDLEIDRGKKALPGFEILPLSAILAEIAADAAKSAAKTPRARSARSGSRKTAGRAARNGKGGSSAIPPLGEVALRVLRRNKVKRVVVPGAFPLEYGDFLRKRGIAVTTGRIPFFQSRLLKTPDEVAMIKEAQEATEASMDAAIQAIRRAEIRGDELWLEGEVLTSERVREIIGVDLLKRGFNAGDPIVAGGIQACDPHEVGHGPLPAHSPIIIDIFPRSMRTGYFGDMTRTVVRGRASDKAKRMYQAVLEGQEIAFRMIRAGVEGFKIHMAITQRFDELGFPTGEAGGRMQGFFHGTGHALGLEIHEPPRIAKVKATLRAGMVLTVEPGLYYEDAGGIRIEDIVVVTKTGSQNLNRYPKELELG